MGSVILFKAAYHTVAATYALAKGVDGDGECTVTVTDNMSNDIIVSETVKSKAYPIGRIFFDSVLDCKDFSRRMMWLEVLEYGAHKDRDDGSLYTSTACDGCVFRTCSWPRGYDIASKCYKSKTIAELPCYPHLRKDHKRVYYQPVSVNHPGLSNSTLNWGIAYIQSIGIGEEQKFNIGELPVVGYQFRGRDDISVERKAFGKFLLKQNGKVLATAGWDLYQISNLVSLAIDLEKAPRSVKKEEGNEMSNKQEESPMSREQKKIQDGSKKYHRIKPAGKECYPVQIIETHATTVYVEKEGVSKNEALNLVDDAHREGRIELGSDEYIGHQIEIIDE